MFVKLRSRYRNDLICRNIFDGIGINSSVCVSRKQYSVCVYLHIICIVMFCHCYCERVFTAVMYRCTVGWFHSVPLTALRRNNIQCVCRKPCINRQIFVNNHCFVNFDSACLFRVPAYKAVSRLWRRIRKHKSRRASIESGLRIVKSVVIIEVRRKYFLNRCGRNKGNCTGYPIYPLGNQLCVLFGNRVYGQCSKAASAYGGYGYSSVILSLICADCTRHTLAGNKRYRKFLYLPLCIKRDIRIDA